MLKRFSAKQYKNIEADNLEFARVTLLVGPNNGGKSNFIEALRFYADVWTYDGDGSAFHQVLAQRGYGEVLRRSVKAPSTIELRWEHEVGSYRQDISYIAFQVGKSEQFPAGFLITGDESITKDPTSDRVFSHKIDEQKPSRYRVALRRTVEGPEEVIYFPFEPTDLFNSDTRSRVLNVGGHLKMKVSEYPDLEDAEWEENEFGKQRFINGSELAPSQIALSVKRNLTILHLNETGSELVNVVNNLERRHNDFLIPYENRLREALPGLERIRIDDVSDQYKSLKLRIDGDWFRLDELSEGTLKMLALALLFFSPEKSSLLSIDEPELNLHPAWLRVLGRWMLTSTGPDQVLASTHSPDLLDALTEGFKNGEVALIVCDAKKGFRNVRVADLDSFFKDGWDLGDLYRVGEPELGGWPW